MDFVGRCSVSKGREGGRGERGRKGGREGDLGLRDLRFFSFGPRGLRVVGSSSCLSESEKGLEQPPRTHIKKRAKHAHSQRTDQIKVNQK